MPGYAIKVSLVERAKELSHLLEEMTSGDVAGRTDHAIAIVADALKARRPVLVCGNGGSASDATHIAGELVGRFLRERKAYNVIALSANASVLTAWANDYEFESVFSRQVEAHGAERGVVWGISTSGNSANVLSALKTARAMGMSTIGLTGKGGGAMADLCDVLIDVPSSKTPRIQEMHTMLYHYICEQIENCIG